MVNIKKNKKIKNWLIFFITLVVLFQTQGCGIVSPFQAIGPVINTIAYWKNGEGHAVYNFNEDIVYRSTKRAIEKMGFSIDYEKIYGKDDQNYKIIFIQENKIKVTIQRKDVNISKVNIRLNTFGDKDFGEMLFKNIEKDINTVTFNASGEIY